MNSEIEVVDKNIDVTKLSAEELDLGVRQLGQIIGYCTFKQGEFLKVIRDDKKYIELDHPSFRSYMASLGMKHATVYKRIHNYKFWILDMGFAPESIQDLTLNSLQIIEPIVETDPSRWLTEARVLSPSDLINSVNEERGREPMQQEEPDDITSFSKKQKSGSSYPEDWDGCAVCHGKPTIQAHFPRSQGAGGIHTIPLCHKHHIGEQHQKGIQTFWNKNRLELTQYYGWLTRQAIVCLPDTELYLLAQLEELLGHISGGYDGRGKEEMADIRGNANSSSGTDDMGADGNTGEEHPPGTRDMVAESVGGRNE